MPKHPIEMIDTAEMKDLAKRILSARDEEVSYEAELTRLRTQAAESRRLAADRHAATNLVLDSFRSPGPNGEELPGFLARLHEACEAERQAEAVAREHGQAYRDCKKASREAHAGITALMGTLEEDMPLIALAIRNARQNDQASSPADEPARETRPAPRRRRIPSTN